MRFRKQFIEQLPIPMANSGPKRTLRDKIIELVDEMIALNKRLGDIGDKKTDERKRIEDDKNAIDAVIDDLVYQLYGIAEEEEKKIIEDSLK